MRTALRFRVLLCIGALTLAAAAAQGADTGTSPTPSSAPGKGRETETPPVKIETLILGLEPGSDLKTAHKKLDKLSDPKTPPITRGAGEFDIGEGRKEGREERDEAGTKVLWQLRETDYRAVFIKADEKGHIYSIVASLRPEKRKPFETIGETSKAPVLTDKQVTWDVIRPNKPRIQVVATGENRMAGVISMFIMGHPGLREERARN